MGNKIDPLTLASASSRVSKSTIGGLGGTLSTADTIRARTDFERDRVDGKYENLTFEEYVKQVWKPAQQPDENGSSN